MPRRKPTNPDHAGRKEGPTYCRGLLLSTVQSRSVRHGELAVKYAREAPLPHKHAADGQDGSDNLHALGAVPMIIEISSAKTGAKLKKIEVFPGPRTAMPTFQKR